MLAQKMLKELLRYDDGKLIWRSGELKGKSAGTQCEDGYVYIGIHGEIYKRANLVWLYFHPKFHCEPEKGWTEC